MSAAAAKFKMPDAREKKLSKAQKRPPHQPLESGSRVINNHKAAMLNIKTK